MENPPNVLPSIQNSSEHGHNEIENVEKKGKEMVEEPKLNMVFNSNEEAFEYYVTYANHLGFEISIKTSRKNEDGDLCFVTFACHRYGFPKRTSQNTLKPHPVQKTNCEAKMNIALCINKKWRVSHYVPHHNHPLASPSHTRYFQFNRVIKPHVRRKLEINDKAGIRMNKSYNSLVVEAGGYDNVTFLEKDCRNYIEKVRRLKLEEGDAIAVQNYFIKMQGKNSSFFYSMDMDDEGRLRNIFWADGRCREAYKEFGDVITFDTTYLTNKYKMPFAPFVGVNHHGQSILLGCGLISGEDTKTFVWLFRTWLTCMLERAPEGIITDQDKAMKNAIEIVFPNTRHRWCLWHIMKKLPEKLKGYNNYESIKSSLQNAVYDSLSRIEFEANWFQMIKQHKLNKNDWLCDLYDSRHRWVPAFVRNSFWAGMSTTQRSESMNAFFDRYVNIHTTLKNFVDQYENALKDKAEKEKYADYKSFNSRVPCITHYKMEEQFQKVYTTAKFQEFQQELTGKMYCEISSSNANGIVSEYEVYEDVKVGEGSKRVTFKVVLNEIHSNEDCEVKCNCCLFEFRGILCRHAVMVLIHKKIFQIPTKYIISRWRKDIKRQHTRVVVSYDDWSCKPEGKRFDKMCSAFHEVADLAIESDKKCNMVVDWIKDFKEKLLVTTDIVNGSQPTQESNLSEANGADNKCTIMERKKPHDPFTIPCKGRPPTKRKESTMEKIVKKKATKNKAAKGQTSPANALIQQPPNNNLACFSSPFDHFSADVSASSQFFPPYQVVSQFGGQSIVSVNKFGGENLSVRNDISTSTWQQPGQIVGFSYGSGIPNLRTPTFQVASANVRSSGMSTQLIPNQNASNATNHDGQ